eukprot:316845-Prorocentrum_minimum.AAC.3
MEGARHQPAATSSPLKKSILPPFFVGTHLQGGHGSVALLLGGEGGLPVGRLRHGPPLAAKLTGGLRLVVCDVQAVLQIVLPHRVGEAGYLEDGGPVEVVAEAARVQRGGHQHHLQEVRVQRPLVHLVHDDVADSGELLVLAEPAEQHAGGAEHQPGRRAAHALQPDLVAHRLPERLRALRRDARRHAGGADAARLRAHQGAMAAGAAEHRAVQDELRHLRGLAAPGLARDHHHLVGVERGVDVVLAGPRGQLGAGVQHLEVLPVLLLPVHRREKPLRLRPRVLRQPRHLRPRLAGSFISLVSASIAITHSPVFNVG